MDIDPKSSVGDLFAEARNRIDGKSMYLSLIIFIIGIILQSAKNIIISDYSFTAWKIVISSCFIAPIIVLIYISLASYSTKNNHFSRLVNALILLSIPGYFYFSLI